MKNIIDTINEKVLDLDSGIKVFKVGPRAGLYSAGILVCADNEDEAVELVNRMKRGLVDKLVAEKL